MIKIENVSKNYRIPVRSSGMNQAFKSFIKREYKTVQALDTINLSINEGEIVGYIGPNGAGKSTTIKILSGILYPDTGTVSIGGIDPFKKRKDHAKQIGVVFGQRTQLWWDLPVGDSFELIKEIYQIPDEVYNKRLTEFLTLFELEDIVLQTVRQLSLGQRVKCDIVAALLHNPKVLFLDEPTIGLDAHSKRQVRELIKQINKIYNTTIILTTHDMQDIEQIVSRVVLIGNGFILFDGSLNSLIDKYGAKTKLELEFQGNLDENPHYVILKQESNYALLELNTDLVKVLETLQKTISISSIKIVNTTIDDVIINLYQEFEI